MTGASTPKSIDVRSAPICPPQRCTNRSNSPSRLQFLNEQVSTAGVAAHRRVTVKVQFSGASGTAAVTTDEYVGSHLRRRCGGRHSPFIERPQARGDSLNDSIRPGMRPKLSPRLWPRSGHLCRAHRNDLYVYVHFRGSAPSAARTGTRAGRGWGRGAPVLTCRRSAHSFESGRPDVFDCRNFCSAHRERGAQRPGRVAERVATRPGPRARQR